MYAGTGWPAEYRTKPFSKKKQNAAMCFKVFRPLYSFCSAPARFLPASFLLCSVSLPDAFPNAVQSAFFNATQRISASLCGTGMNK